MLAADSTKKILPNTFEHTAQLDFQVSRCLKSLKRRFRHQMSIVRKPSAAFYKRLFLLLSLCLEGFLWSHQIDESVGEHLEKKHLDHFIAVLPCCTDAHDQFSRDPIKARPHRSRGQEPCLVQDARSATPYLYIRYPCCVGVSDWEGFLAAFSTQIDSSDLNKSPKDPPRAKKSTSAAYERACICPVHLRPLLILSTFFLRGFFKGRLRDHLRNKTQVTLWLLLFEFTMLYHSPLAFDFELYSFIPCCLQAHFMRIQNVQGVAKELEMSECHKVLAAFSEGWNDLWLRVHAGGMGFLCGSLHALGPDHLATLVTFSALLGLIRCLVEPPSRT